MHRIVYGNYLVNWFKLLWKFTVKVIYCWLIWFDSIWYGRLFDLNEKCPCTYTVQCPVLKIVKISKYINETCAKLNLLISLIRLSLTQIIWTNRKSMSHTGLNFHLMSFSMTTFDILPREWLSSSNQNPVKKKQSYANPIYLHTV